ncbi:hypothetical protein ACFLU6_14135 [Acidobacteriota bacterium]
MLRSRFLISVLIAVMLSISCHQQETSQKSDYSDVISRAAKDLSLKAAEAIKHDFTPHDPFSDIDFDLIASLGESEGNAAQDYCEFMKSYDRNNKKPVMLNGEERFVYDTLSPEVRYLYQALTRRDCWFLEPEDYNPPFLIDGDPTDWGACSECDFLHLVDVGKGLVYQGDKFAKNLQLSEALESYRSIVIMGRHLWEEHGALLSDKVGIILIKMGNDAILRLLDDHTNLRQDNEALYSACMDFSAAYDDYQQQQDVWWATLYLLDEDPSKWDAGLFRNLEIGVKHEFPSYRVETLASIARARFASDLSISDRVTALLENALSDPDPRVSELAKWGLTHTKVESDRIWKDDE